MPWRGPEQPGEFPTLGYVALEWIKDTLVIPEGPKAGDPFELYDEQAMHVLRRCRLDPDVLAGNDAFVHRGSQMIRGQKWGKDPVLAVLDLFHAFGPCDFDGYDANGEPVGRPHPSPWIFVAALNDKQADNTWLLIKAIVEMTDLADLPGVDVTLDQIRLPCGNPIEKLTTTAYGRLGGRFTSGSLTENGLFTDTNKTGAGGGQRSPLSFARTLIRSVLNMGGMWQAASNTWDPTERSHAQIIAEANRGRSRTFVDKKIARKRVDLTNDAELSEELTWLYGDSLTERGGHVSLRNLIADCRDFETHGEVEIRRFFLSEILAGEEPLCTPERWAALDRSSPRHPDYRPLEPGEAITLGFDGSRSRDATVITACRISDGRLFHQRTWIPRCMCPKPVRHKPEQCNNRKIPRAQVDKAMDDFNASYEVWYTFGDPYKWQDALERWAAKYRREVKRGRKTVVLGQVVEVPTNVETRMDHMLERFTTARDNDEVTHDGDPTLTAHVRDAAIAKGRQKPSKPREDGEGNVIQHYRKVVKKAEGVLIDAAISGPILAFEARGQAIEDGALTQKPKKDPISPRSYRGRAETDETATKPSTGRRGGRGADDTEPDWNDVSF